jgi:hypothetical protein
MAAEADALGGLRHSTTERLRRQYAALEQLPAQVAAWRAQAEAEGALEKHQSQIEALQEFLTILQTGLVASWNNLEGAADVAAFCKGTNAFQSTLRRVYGAWHFYRERFNDRRAKDDPHARYLTVAEEVANDAYRAAADQAVSRGLSPAKQTYRQPPLLHLFDDPRLPSVVTRVRHAVIPNLPVHVIDLPYAETACAWNLLSLTHEVAHGLVGDWGMDCGNIVLDLKKAEAAGLPMARRERWALWAEEIFADCFAVLLAGPPFVRECMDLYMALEPGDPKKGGGAHPPPYLRIPLLCAFLRTLERQRPLGKDDRRDEGVDKEYQEFADHCEATWQALHASVAAAPFRPFRKEFAAVLTLLMDTPLEPLAGNTARSLGAFTPADWRRLKRVGEDQLANGQEAGEKIAPRLAVGAARVALDKCLAETGAADLPECLRNLHENTLLTVEENIPKGVRALPPGSAKFLAGLAEAFVRGGRDLPGEAP